MRRRISAIAAIIAATLVSGTVRQTSAATTTVAGRLQLMADISLGSGSSNPQGGITLGSRFLFTATDATNGRELWITDGTSGGTQLLKDINPGSSGGYANNSNPDGFVVLGSRAIFQATDATNGLELWITDGTSGGTQLLKDINPGSSGSYPTGLVAFGSNVLFRADDGTNGTELWITDGTSGGTQLLKDIHTGSAYGYPSSSSPAGFTVLGTKAVFQAIDGTSGAELWITDGTSGGTQLLKDINPGSSNGTPNYGYPAGFTVLGARIIFNANDGTNGYEPWTTDGTPGGTQLLKDINPGSSGASPTGFFKAGVSVYFFAYTSSTGTEPWITDGTPAGTRIITDINPGVSNSGPWTCFMCGYIGVPFVKVGSRILFHATDGSHGYEPWTTDGTAAGTRMLDDTSPGSGGSIAGSSWFSTSGAPSTMIVFNNRAIFAANDGQSGNELWTLLGLPGTPRSVTANPSANAVEVSWSAPLDPGADPDITYVVTSSPGGYTCSTTTSSCTVIGLLANNDYIFTVSATSSVGNSEQSATSGRVRTISPQLGSLVDILTGATDIVANPTLAKGSSRTILYRGFNPRELVLVLLGSDPTVIGSANADANGNVAVTAVVPSAATTGSQNLIIYAPVSGFGAKQPVTVSADSGGSGTSATTSSTAGTKITAKAAKSSSVISVVVTGSSVAARSIKVQAFAAGKWKSLSKSYRTSASGTVTIDLGKGTYRVTVAATAGAPAATSSSVRLVK